METPSPSFNVPLFPYDRWNGIENLTAGVRRADELGIGAISFPDHVIMPVREGAPRISTMWYDNLVLAAHLAAHTKRIRFFYNALVFPYRPAVQLAKMISTLDVVSGGRLTVGVASGWLRGEFRTLRVPFRERGAMTDEYLRAMKILWTEDEPEFHGRYTEFERIAFEPKCAQKPHVPLWIAGSGPICLRRVVELGDGWTPMVGTLDELRQQGEWIREEAYKQGRDPASITFAWGISIGEADPVRESARSHASQGQAGKTKSLTAPQEIIDHIQRYREIGFSDISLHFGWENVDDYVRQLEFIAEKIIPAFAG